jgi:hypothetical protein
VAEGAEFGDISTQFGGDRAKFCKWRSFQSRVLVGWVSLTPEPQPLWDKLEGKSPTGVAVCNIARMVDAGWTLEPMVFQLSSFNEECLSYGLQLNDSSELDIARLTQGLPELCFRAADSSAFMLAAFGSTLHAWYTLPVRYVRQESDLMRLWFDADEDAAWRGRWPELVLSAAKERRHDLVPVECPSVAPAQPPI